MSGQTSFSTNSESQTAAQIPTPHRDPFTASNAAREERDKLVALSATIASLTDADMPLEPELLPEEIGRVLTIDDRHFWLMLDESRRLPMLRRAHQRNITAAERNLQRALRSDTCGHYIELLCQLVHTSRREVGEEAYEELRGRYLAAKSEWEKIRRSPKPKHAARISAGNEHAGSPGSEIEPNRELTEMATTQTMDEDSE